MRYRLVLFAVVFGMVVSAVDAKAQKVALGTNVIDYANMGTLNLSLSVAAGKNCTVGANVRYNPWVINKGQDNQFNQNMRNASLDIRWWPWHVYSGWWILFKGQFTEYNVGGMFYRKGAEQGYAYGGGLGAGYAILLGKHWNVDFGLSFWGGMKNYHAYDCAYCGHPTAGGKKGFIAPDNLFVSFYYVF